MLNIKVVCPSVHFLGQAVISYHTSIEDHGKICNLKYIFVAFPFYSQQLQYEWDH